MKRRKTSGKRQRGGFNWAGVLKATRDQGMSGLLNNISSNIIQSIARRTRRQRGGKLTRKQELQKIRRDIAVSKAREAAIKRQLAEERKVVENPFFQLLLHPRKRLNPATLPGVYNKYSASRIRSKLENFQRNIKRQKQWD